MTNGPLLEDPISVLERGGVAQQCTADLNLPMPAILDRMDDAVSKAYQGHPDRLYLVGKNGKISYAGARGPFGFDPEGWSEAIEKEVRAQKGKHWF